ncbi:MAG: hypothetical protein MZV63_51720 [Marinilabiliales bacterium]|nr:hypothetical protein [Marinilabiliales bacterium]
MANLCQLLQFLRAPCPSDRVMRIREDEHFCGRGDELPQSLSESITHPLLSLQEVIEHQPVGRDR